MSLVARTSSSPSADPWAAPVFCLFGAGQPMIVRSTISDGRPVSAWATASARSTAARSSPSSTCCTCQPYASYRVPTSSVNAMAVLSSIEIRLAS